MAYSASLRSRRHTNSPGREPGVSDLGKDSLSPEGAEQYLTSDASNDKSCRPKAAKFS